jgi:hypothetical protein
LFQAIQALQTSKMTSNLSILVYSGSQKTP